MDSDSTVKGPCFHFQLLPFELQRLILSLALDTGASPACVASLSWPLHSFVVSRLYSHIHLPSLDHLLLFLSAPSGTQREAALHARSFTLSIPGVPGGSTMGGRESAPGSPNVSQARHLDERLLLASRAIQMCPLVQHCSLEMFGVRHSSLLTSNDFIADESNAFRTAISSLKALHTFAWTTPRENVNFVGFSVAIVDLVFEPLVEGLELAALDMHADGRRVAKPKADSQRYRHPLREITLHHCIFPSNHGKHFFQLFAKTHPDDGACLLFPHLSLISIKKAINVDPHNVAFLALFWQMILDRDATSSDWNPSIVLEDVFVKSIWGVRLTGDLINVCLNRLVALHLVKAEEVAASNNKFIRALEESIESSVKLDEEMCAKLQSMSQHHRESLIARASQRIKVGFVEGAIAGYE